MTGKYLVPMVLLYTLTQLLKTGWGCHWELSYIRSLIFYSDGTNFEPAELPPYWPRCCFRQPACNDENCSVELVS